MRTPLTSGIWCPSLTPFDDVLRVETGLLAQHCRWLLEEGAHGIVLFGTTGEANSLAVADRCAALEAVLGAGIPPESIMVGIGCCALDDTAALGRHALANGCIRVLALPPFYYKNVPETGVIEAYARAIDAIGDARMRFYFYRIPQLSGVDITPAIIDAVLARFGDTIAGLKDSSGDAASIEDLCRQYARRLDVLVGSERYLSAALALGASGCITATANVFARSLRELYEQPGRQLQERATAERAKLEGPDMIAALKAATSRRTGDARWCHLRPPLGAPAAATQTPNAARR